METTAAAYETSAYAGDEGYVFVSYAHEDAALVFPEVGWLQRREVNVWFDEGIRPGATWRDEIADRITRCEAFVYFVSKQSLASENCIKEANFAIDHRKPFLVVYLDDSELPGGLKLYVNDRQAISVRSFAKERFRQKLLEGVLNAQQPPTPLQGGSRRSGRRNMVIATVFVVVAALAGMLLRTFSEDDRTTTASDASTDSSVAVMRFTTTGEDTRFSDGLSESLHNLLARIPELIVPARMSSWALTGSGLDAREVSGRLNVQFVLDGSVTISGEELRVDTQLVDGSTGVVIWTNRFDRTLSADSYFAIQDAIAHQVIEELEVTLSNVSRLALNNPNRTSDLRALEAYLNGRALLRLPYSDQDSDEAVELFQQAITLDPNFAEARAGLCDAHLAKFTARRDDAHYEAGEQACLDALALNGSLAEVVLSLGSLYRHAGRVNEALIQFDRARALMPNAARVLEERGRALRILGRMDAAEASFEAAIRTEPANWSVHKSMGNFLVRTGRSDEAIPFYKYALVLDPENRLVRGNLGAAYFNSDEFELAIETWEPILESGSHLVLVNYANALFYAHRFSDSVAAYRAALGAGNEDYRTWGGLAASIEQLSGRQSAQREYRTAIRLAREALDINPTDTLAISSLGLYYARTNQMALSRDQLERLDPATMNNPTDVFLLALAFVDLKEHAQAEAALARAAELGMSEVVVRLDPNLASWRAGLAQPTSPIHTTLNNSNTGEKPEDTTQ